jgi:glycosyltransferase involved in cell wall biosynthesis
MVFPSTWAEPFGLVPIEAMACGVPVVATGVGGSREFLVDGENCLLFTPGDEASLVEAVRRLASDPGLRARLVRNGLETAAELDVDRLADDMEAWHVYEAGGAVGPPPRQLILHSTLAADPEDAR